MKYCLLMWTVQMIDLFYKSKGYVTSTFAQEFVNQCHSIVHQFHAKLSSVLFKHDLLTVPG